MRLIRLSANKDGFKTVNFNKSGLTIIVGVKSKDGSNYNGVGKSLIIELIHFCLGSKTKTTFKEKIPRWEFTLEFEMANGVHTATRNTSQQNIILLDNHEIKLDEFNKVMESTLFTMPEGINSLTYRSLLPKFIRRGAKQYADPTDTGDFTPYDRLLRNAFLLGIDVHLIARKKNLRDEILRIDNLRKSFKEDSLLRDFFSGGKDPEIHLRHLENQIRRLEADKDKFIVAENYYELQKAADYLASQIENQKNQAFLIRNALENIYKSIKEQPELSLERLQHVYGEIATVFKPESLKRLEDISDFHKRLLENRIARLSREKNNLEEQLDSSEALIRVKQKELDEHLQILGTSRALDQYTSIVNTIADLKVKAGKIMDYQAIVREFSNKKADLDRQLSDEVIKANIYLDQTHEYREKNFSVFKEFVDRFYPDAEAGISLKNNDGDNMLRFDLKVHVENDNSDGINEVKIFCYDMTLLTLRKGHKNDFIFHDSRLFANIDVRKRAMLFKVAHETSLRNGFQYIATLNPDFISGMAQEFIHEELDAIINNNIVLELKDSSPSEKLLGMQVDMRYDDR